MSSYVLATSGALATASADLAGIGRTIGAAYGAAAPSTMSVAAAAQDEVSAAIARLFATYAQEQQTLSAQAEAFHAGFVHALDSAGAAYSAAEAANTSPLQSALDAVNGPVQALTGRPLIGDGANATTPGGNGGDGGILWGDGGNGAAGTPTTGQNGGNGGSAGFFGHGAILPAVSTMPAA